MEEDTVVGLPRPGGTVGDDLLLGVLRDGARRMLMPAIEAEVAAFLAAHDDLVDERGRRRLVRNGHALERTIQSGIGPVAVRRPKVRDRGAADGVPIRFTSAVLPAYLRRTRNVEALVPWLYLKGIATGQLELALVFKRARSAERHWRRLDGSDRLAQVIEGVRFRDGAPLQAAEDHAAA